VEARKDKAQGDDSKGIEWLRLRMAQRRGFETVEAWQKAEKAEAHLTR